MTRPWLVLLLTTLLAWNAPPSDRGAHASSQAEQTPTAESPPQEARSDLSASETHAVGSPSPTRSSDADPIRGREIAREQCSSCHGPGGNSLDSEAPSLAGQRLQPAIKQLKDFRDGIRRDTTMAEVAGGLSEKDIFDVAAYYATKKISAGAPNLRLADKAKRLYQRGRKGVVACAPCHGRSGEGLSNGIPRGVPSVRGQLQDYLVRVLKGYRDRSLTNDWKGVMYLATRNLSDEEIHALSEYMNGLAR